MVTTETEAWPASRIVALVGIILYLATGVFPYLASGLVAPLWGIAALYVGWLVGLWVTIRLFRARSAWTLAMPLVALGFWWLVITLGESFFDWTA
jgi:hypothetical protein